MDTRLIIFIASISVAPGGAIAYSIITPIGVAVGLGIRHTYVCHPMPSHMILTRILILYDLFDNSYDPHSATASMVAGVLDSLSAGILLYTGLVELLAHDFIFSREMAIEVSGFVSAWLDWS